MRSECHGFRCFRSKHAHREKWFDWADALELELKQHRLWPSNAAEVQLATTYRPLLSSLAAGLTLPPVSRFTRPFITYAAAQRLSALAKEDPCLSDDIVIGKACEQMLEKLNQLEKKYRKEGSTCIQISVIIPFFQREPGILIRALNSIKSQNIPDGWSVEVIVVDDGSPRPAHDEVGDLHCSEPLHLKVLRQENGGVAAARNRGLEEVDQSATLIAFLDSDDIWPANHLAHAIQAIDSGLDFYFTDNRRAGHHSSYIGHCAPETGKLLATTQQKTGVVEIPADQIVGLIVKEFPTQASTVVYKRNVAADLRFNTKLKAAGEDVLFFSMLAGNAKRIGFDLDNCIECGSGVNMYFGNFEWDSPKCMAIRVDQVLAHRLIGKMVKLSPESKKRNDVEVMYYRRELGFQTMRNLVKHPARVPKEIARLIRSDPRVALMLPLDMICVALGQVFGSGRGKSGRRASVSCLSKTSPKERHSLASSMW